MASDNEGGDTKSFATSQIVTVFVGPKRKAFSLHKDVLLEKCPFFDRCLKDSYKEGQEAQVYLTEDDPSAFSRFVDWIYQEKVKTVNFGDVRSVICGYVLADKFCMNPFKNKVVDALREWYKENVVQIKDLEYISEAGPSNSQLEQFMFDQIVFDLMYNPAVYFPDQDEASIAKCDFEDAVHNGGDIVVDLMWAMCAFHRKGHNDPSQRKGCHYHEHDENHSICK